MNNFTVQTEHLLYTVSYKDSKGGLGSSYYIIYIGKRMRHMCNVPILSEVLSEINFYEKEILGKGIEEYADWDSKLQVVANDK
tara:strand:- start:118 stop:366 length:249 start_codon:yes stop_codon:yes gene_type:complete